MKKTFTIKEMQFENKIIEFDLEEFKKIIMNKLNTPPKNKIKKQNNIFKSMVVEK